MENLTPKQRAFCNEYLIDMNATRAYKAAYPNVKSENTAMSNGSKLLRNAKVKAFIANHLQQIEDKKIADAKEVMEYLSSVMRGEIREEVVVTRGVGEGISVIERVKKEVSPKDRNKAAELLGKRYAMFTEKIEADVQQKVVFADESKLED